MCIKFNMFCSWHIENLVKIRSSAFFGKVYHITEYWKKTDLLIMSPRHCITGFCQMSFQVWEYCDFMESFSLLLCPIKAVLQSSSMVWFYFRSGKPSQKYVFPKSHLHKNCVKFLPLSECDEFTKFS